MLCNQLLNSIFISMCHYFHKKHFWNLRKFTRWRWNLKASVLSNFYINFLHQVFRKDIRAATLIIIIMHISTTIFNCFNLFSNHSFGHKDFSIHFTDLPMNFNTFISFVLRKTNDREYFAVCGICNWLKHFEYSQVDINNQILPQ